MVYDESTYLIHHGIKGQKWGVRRYQNEDGSLTQKGIKRYAYDRDINDKSYSNVAKIRTGEAKRRYDVAKSNNETNHARLAQLRRNIRSAKKQEKLAKTYDKAAKLESKGKSITKNYMKESIAYGASALGGYALSKKLSKLKAEKNYDEKHRLAADIIQLAGSATLSLGSGLYATHLESQNNVMRQYDRAHWRGETSKKHVGGDEYQSRLKTKNKYN